MGRSAGGWRLVCLDRVGSTNDVVRRAGELGLTARLAVFAELQTAGRGRAGRSWQSPAGLGLTGSTLWQPPVSGERAGTLAQVAGIAAVRALGAVGVGARLKWPNDVLIGEAKCGGILIEIAFEGDRVAVAVVGIGLNVLQRADDLPSTPYPATSIQLATGRTVDRNLLAAELLTALAEGYERWLVDPLKDFDAWRAALSTLGRRVTVQGRAGIARDVEPSGALVIERADGSVLRLLSGDVAVAAPGLGGSGSRPRRLRP